MKSMKLSELRSLPDVKGKYLIIADQGKDKVVVVVFDTRPKRMEDKPIAAYRDVEDDRPPTKRRYGYFNQEEGMEWKS